MRQQVFTTLTQSYEEVRLREVRDTPVITMIEAPTARIMPEPRGRVMMVFIGGLLGAAFGILLVAISAQMRREGEAGGGGATELAWQALRRDGSRD